MPSWRPFGELVASIPPPRRDHRQYQDPAVAQQAWIEPLVVLGDSSGRVGDVEFDWPTAARLEVDDQRPGLGGEHVARVRLAVVAWS